MKSNKIKVSNIDDSSSISIRIDGKEVYSKESQLFSKKKASKIKPLLTYLFGYKDPNTKKIQKKF